MPPNPTPLPEIPPAVASRKAQAVPSSQRTASHPAPSSAPLTACDWASCNQPLGSATGLRPRIAASDPSSPLGRPRARQPPRKSSRPNPLHRSHSLRSEMYPALRRYSTHTLRSPSPERRGGQGVRTGTVRHRAPLAATKQGPYRPRLPPAEIRHATHLVHPGARRRTRLPGDPSTRHLGQRQASDRRRERPMAPTHEQRPFRLDRRVLRRRRASHAAQHGSDARQGCGPGVLRDPQYDRPTPDSDPPCRDRGGQWTGGRRDRAVALGLRRRRQAAAGHASRGLGQVHRTLGTAKRTLAHGGRRLEQRLAVAHGACRACAGTGATIRSLTLGPALWALAACAPARARAPASSPEPAEVRALWVVRSPLADPDSARAMVRRAAEAGFNTLILQVRGRRGAYYHSRWEPPPPALAGRNGYDALDRTIREAHRRRLRVHAWLSTQLVANADSLPTDSTHFIYRRPDLLAVPRPLARELYDADPRDPHYVQALAEYARANRDHVEGLYTSPAAPDVKEHLYSVWIDLVERYQLDGLHFDYVRYPAPDYDYSRVALERFRDWLVPTLPDSVRTRFAQREPADALAYR